MKRPAGQPAPPAANGNGGKPLIGLTMGDPLGIGPEVLLKALANPAVRGLGRFIIYGIEAVLQDEARRQNVPPFWFRVAPDDVGRIDSGVVVADFDRCAPFDAGACRPTAEGGEASLRFVEAGIAAARQGVIDALVTGPIHKVSWRLAGCRFAGHTEKLADAFHEKRITPLFVGGGMRVALASGHVPLFELRNHFTIGLVFQPIDLLAEALTRWFGIAKPRIAVAGLNPHAGEDGQFGDEERRVIEPAMQMARQAGIDVRGPFPADSLFVPQHLERFDGIVAMYHDQGLIPLKARAFHAAAQVTLGLPILRVSVDHGTAFDIARTNHANPGSMIEAITLACDLARHKGNLTSDLPAALATAG